MITKKILVIIPLVIAVAYIIGCWMDIANHLSVVLWRHWSALILLLVVIYFLFKDLEKAVIATGIFFLLGTFGAFSLTSGITTTRLRIGSLETPPFNSLCFGLFFLFIVLNCVTIINLHLDHKEAKSKKSKS